MMIGGEQETKTLFNITNDFEKNISLINNSFVDKEKRVINSNSDKQLEEIIIELENTNREKDELIKKQRIQNLICENKMKKKINDNISKNIDEKKNMHGGAEVNSQEIKLNDLTQFIIAIKNPKENITFLKKIRSEIDYLISQNELISNTNTNTLVNVGDSSIKKINKPTDKQLLETFKKNSTYLLDSILNSSGAGKRVQNVIINYIDRNNIKKYFTENDKWVGYFQDFTDEQKDSIMQTWRTLMPDSLLKYIFNRNEIYDTIEKAAKGDQEAKQLLINNKEKFYDLLKFENDIKILESDLKIDINSKKSDNLKLKDLWLFDNSSSIINTKSKDEQKIKGYLYDDLIV